MKELQELAVEFRDERNWKQFHTVKDLILDLGIEVGELAELVLWKKAEEIESLLTEESYRTKVADELADVQVTLLFLADVTGIDLEEAVRVKMKKNAEKYPVEKSYGSSKKYTEL